MTIAVATAADLNDVRNNLSGEYIQTADIDMAGVSFTSIGYFHGLWPDDIFTGSYDGGGYTISNLTASPHAIADGVGMFGCIGAGAVIQNVKLLNVSVSGTAAVGGLVGYSIGGNSIYNCFVDGSVTADYYNGLLVGATYEIIGGTFSIAKCAVKGTVAGSGSFDYAGGLIGYVDNGTAVLNCYSRANVTGGGRVGGLLGAVLNASVTNCYATGTVPAGTYHGGLIGASSGTVNNSYYDSETSGRSDTGKGTPRTTAEMTYPENFTTTFIEWDFDTIWTHDSSYTINDGYPVFGGFRIWVKKSPNPSFLPPLWLDWKTVPVLWVYKEFEWKSVTGVWIKKGDEWKTV